MSSDAKKKKNPKHSPSTPQGAQGKDHQRRYRTERRGQENVFREETRQNSARLLEVNVHQTVYTTRLGSLMASHPRGCTRCMQHMKQWRLVAHAEVLRWTRQSEADIRSRLMSRFRKPREASLTPSATHWSDEDEAALINAAELTGAAIGTAAWVTNVGNERGENLMGVLTAAEREGLAQMMSGIVQQYADQGHPEYS
ncbi:hypothetical protein CAPTEDRAFT_201761 [Capitella teleta]|uniref:Uncharacterized protein n=1 Tax=Capitella teleta TaxID=283909 RepID=R7T4C5_CAPTE|nr:hypothetical protein CAPTEDRAFT_201761 [Capitella teleta]|eukprot:ELT87832.1 hypothetical protein CAPTEDRAFT_201761 [Capitella teleta]